MDLPPEGLRKRIDLARFGVALEDGDGAARPLQRAANAIQGGLLEQASRFVPVCPWCPPAR